MSEKEHRIVVIGAGTGGTIVTNQLHKKLKKAKINYNITVIDPHFKHLYQPGFLFTMLGREKNENLVKDSRKMMPKSVNAMVDKVKIIDTKKKVVKTENGEDVPYDYLVLAPGSRLAFDAVDWWDDSIHHFYNPSGAENLRHALENFDKGTIVVSIADLPYKCPPAPVEASMLIDDYYRRKGKRDDVDIIYTSPLGRAFSIETTNTRVEPYLKEKDIELMTMFNADDVDTEERVIYSMEGEEVEYDLLVMVPPHRGQKFVIDSGLASGQGWIPVDKYTLEVENHPGVFALGDATNLPISKAGSTAHHEAPVIAENIRDLILKNQLTAKYDGHVQCFFLTEIGKSMFIDFDYSRPPKPSPTRRLWWYFKLMFKPLYFRMVTKARV